ncbi:MAG: hypothetical protein HC889_05040 [Synechococcaceae cyanobacterium SM1_2_3]|nr:hypothetical protein [Synechococcaceae cyanobacterium SM1_2_3]
MSTVAETIRLATKDTLDEGSALEYDFPIVELSQVAEQESWRKEINRPLYHIHKWWATRLGSVFRAIVLAALSPRQYSTWREFYKIHSLKEKVVLDPFMGSGTTLGEAIKLGAKVVGCDINPVSTFLVRQGLTRVSEAQLRIAFEKLKQEVAPEIRRYYQTRDPLNGEFIPVLYFFWIKILTTPDGEVIPLFNQYVFSRDAYPRKKPKAQILCPNCWNVIEDRYDATDLECPVCQHRFNPQNGPANGQYVVTKAGNRYRIKDLLSEHEGPPKHRLYALMALRPGGEKIYITPGQEDLALYQAAKARLETETLPLPTLAVRSGHNTDQARGYHYFHWRDFFNDRQLLCLGLLLQAILRIEDEVVQEQLLCLFSSTLEFNNLFCSFKGEGTGAVRPIFSNHILKPERMALENSIWGTGKSSGTFCTLFESRLIRAKHYLDEPFEVAVQSDLLGDRMIAHKVMASHPIDTPIVTSWNELTAIKHGALILNGDSSRLPLPDTSVDAVVTDPPYFDFIHYSELSDFFFAWLSPVLRDRYLWFGRENSSGAGEVQHNDPIIFAQQLSRVLIESRRVLKDNGVLALSFHHSRPEGWTAIYEAIAYAGLFVVAAYPVHAELRAANSKSAAKEPISVDAILVCKKRLPIIKINFELQSVYIQMDKFTHQLQKAGMVISNTDRFVIGASQFLILASTKSITLDQMNKYLVDLKVYISGSSAFLIGSE